MNWILNVIPEASLSAAVDAEIRDLLCRCFPPDTAIFSQTRYWHGSPPSYSVICRVEGHELAGHIGIVVRTIRAGVESVTVAGVQNMAVAPDRRGSGIGPALMNEALDEARRRGVEAGILFCVPELAKYYGRGGWQVHDVPVRMDYSGRRDMPIPGKNICMVYELAGKPFPPGLIQLQGPDW